MPEFHPVQPQPALVGGLGGGESAAAHPDETGAAGNLKSLDGLKLIVVEDDFFIGIELAQFLTSLGARVSGPHSTVAAGREALAAGYSDGALLDVNLGRETSLPFASELKSAGVPFLFVTAYADEDRLFDGDLAAAPRLGKPVARSLLRRRAVEIFA